MSTNLLAHSRKKWRKRGYYVEGTESVVRLPGGRTHRSDLFGFADLVAVPEDEDAWLYLQVTSWGNVSARLRKIQNETTGTGQHEMPLRELAKAVLDHGDRILIEGWKQKNGKGSRWVSREHWVSYEDLADD